MVRWNLRSVQLLILLASISITHAVNGDQGNVDELIGTEQELKITTDDVAALWGTEGCDNCTDNDASYTQQELNKMKKRMRRKSHERDRKFNNNNKWRIICWSCQVRLVHYRLK